MQNGTVIVKPEPKKASRPFDIHSNDAAKALFMLAQGAQGRNGIQASNQLSTSSTSTIALPASATGQNSNASPQMSSGNVAAQWISQGTNGSEELECTNPTKDRGKKATVEANGRRKADNPPANAKPNKKAKCASVCNVGGAEDSDEEDGEDDTPKLTLTDGKKRKNFLERNRLAALKCRQRKKQWLANLQNKVELYGSENNALTAHIALLRDEVVNLKTLLLAHEDCLATQHQGAQGAFMPQVVEPFNA